MYFLLSFVPVIFNFLCVYIADWPFIYLLRFFLNWFAFPALLICINIFSVAERKIRPLGSSVISFLVMAGCYGAAFFMHFTLSNIPFEMFSIKAILITNAYFTVPFICIVIYNIFISYMRKGAKKRKKKKIERREKKSAPKRRRGAGRK